MAGMVTWSLLRQLAGFRAENGCATSLYLNLDPSEVPTAGDAQTRMNALLNSAEKTDRDGAQGVVVFAAGLDNLWSTLALPEPVPDRFKVGHELYLAPLVPVVARA